MSQDNVIRWFDTWAKQGRADQLEADHLDVVAQVLERLHVAPGERVLDLGCGNGWATRKIAQMAAGVQAIGVDCSPEMIARAEALHSLTIRARYDLGSIEKLDFKDGSFSRVFSMEALYYCSDLDAALRESLRVLKPTGQADVVVDYFKENPASAAWAATMNLPLQWLGAEEWRSRFERAGFVNVRTERLFDRRCASDAREFQPDCCVPDHATHLALRAAGSLWIRGEKAP
jgi:SAM-dependent methyltransferase